MEGKEKASALSRRSFLKMAALASGAAATGSMLSACSSIGEAQVHAGVEETVCMTYCNACMGCPLEAVVRNDNVVFTRAAEIPDTDRDIKRMCARGASIPVQLVEGKRIKYPMKRVEGTERGAGQWERISWDEAINTICEKIKGYQNEFGKSSVCAFTYGTTEPRNLYNLYRLENLAEFSHQERTTDFALAQALYVNIGGYYFQGGNDWDIIESCKTFVVWGHNPIVSWPNTWRAIANAIENNGCKLVVVDPNYNTIAQKSDLFVSVRPGTDGALALGMINYMEENGMTADSYMQKRSCAPFLVKTSDGMFLRKSDLDASIAKGSADDDYAVWDEATGTLGYASTASSPALRMKDLTVEGQQVSTSYSLLLDAAAQYPMDRTAEIVTVSEDVIKEFCNLLVNNGEAEIFQGYGVDHYGQGFQNLAAIDALRIVAGLVKDPAFPYSLNDSGFASTETEHATTSASLGTFMFNDLIDKGSYQLPGCTMENGGQTVEVPGPTVDVPLKMLLSFGANLLNSCPDRNDTLKAYRNIDFHVAVNVEWCDTCDMADIVLPAAMIQESIGTMAIDGCVLASERCITPRFEAKPDYEIAQLIGQGIGLEKYFQDDMEAGMAHTLDTQVFNAMGLDYDALKQAKIIYMDKMSLPAPPHSDRAPAVLPGNTQPVPVLRAGFRPVCMSPAHVAAASGGLARNRRRFRGEPASGEVPAATDGWHPPIPRTFLLRAEPPAARDGDRRALRAHEPRRCRGARNLRRRLREALQRPRPRRRQGVLLGRHPTRLPGHRPRLAGIAVQERLQPGTHP